MTLKALPQMILLVLMVLSLGMDLANDGKEITKKTSFRISLFAFGISLALLYWGGWFDVFIGG